MNKLKQKPNGIWFIETLLPDAESGALKRARVSFDTRDKADAEAQRRDWIAGIHPKHPAQGGVVAPKGRVAEEDGSTRQTKRVDGMTVNRWLSRCLKSIWAPPAVKVRSVPNHRSNVKMLGKFIADDLLLGDLTATHIVEIVRRMREEDGYADGSIKKLLGALSASLSHAIDTEDPEAGGFYLASKPKFPTIVVRNVQDRVVSFDEETALFAAIDARIDAEPLRPWWKFKMLVMVMLDTGFRLGEAMQLGQRSVRRKRWLDQTGAAQEGVYLGLDRYITKNEKPREVPATRRVLDVIPILNAQASAGRWFPWPEGSSGPWYMWDNIRDDLAAAGYDLSDVKQHTFRHTCLTRLAEGGMDLIGLRDWAGHSDIKITADRYIHLMSSHLYRGASILDTFRGSVPPVTTIDEPDEEQSVIRDSLLCGGNRADPGMALAH